MINETSKLYKNCYIDDDCTFMRVEIKDGRLVTSYISKRDVYKQAKDYAIEEIKQQSFFKGK